MRAEASNFDGIHTYIELCLQTELVQCAALTEELPTKFGIPITFLSTCSSVHACQIRNVYQIGRGNPQNSSCSSPQPHVCVCVCVCVKV